MKKNVIRLTESDMVRLVKRVVREQFNDSRKNRPDDFEFGDKIVKLINAPKKRIQLALSKLPMNVSSILISDGEEVDFSDVDICSYPKLEMIIVKNTPNNFSEVVDCDWEDHGDGIYLKLQ